MNVWRLYFDCSFLQVYFPFLFVDSMNYKNITLSILASGLIASTVFAAVASVAPVTSKPKVVKQSDTSLSIEWNPVQNAAGYRVKYDTRSIENATDPTLNYTNISSIVTTTGTTIDNLKPNTNYYFSIVSLDASGSEAEFDSPELSVAFNGTLSGVTTTGATTAVSTTSTTATQSVLSIANVRVFDNKHIAVDFSTLLAKDTAPKLSITKSSDNSNVEVANVKIDLFDNKRAIVDLSGALSANTAYTIRVISAKTASNISIADTANVSKDFTTSKDIIDATAGSLNAPSNPNAVSATGNVLTGSTASSGSTASGAVKTNQAPQKLPNTGASDVVLLLLFLTVSGLIFSMKKRNA